MTKIQLKRVLKGPMSTGPLLLTLFVTHKKPTDRAKTNGTMTMLTLLVACLKKIKIDSAKL